MSISEFEVLSKLGEGAFSSVFKVIRKSDGQQYSLKKVKLGSLKQKEKENALNEVRILASVYHPNIIAYKEAFLDEPTNTLCIVMELAESGDLLKKISTHKSSRTFFPENEVWTALVQVTQGLKVLHDSKILHRDLKCANIFISKDNVMKLGDLNVSKVNKRGLAYTQTGTPYYASPEVWKDQPYNSSSDIWSLGCVIYEMAALAPPFTASDMQGLYQKIIRGVYPNIPSQYSSDLGNVIRTLLQVNPSLRPNCDKILEMPPVQRHISIQLMPNPQTADLLGTIKFEPGKNLKQKLPAANYEIRNRGMSAHSARAVEEPQPLVRGNSARGGREDAIIDANRVQAKIADKVENYDYRPQVKDVSRYPVKNEVYEPLVKKPTNNVGLYEIPEVRVQNPYSAQYRPEKYNPTYENKPVIKNPSNENLYRPASREVNYANVPNQAVYRPEVPAYKPPSRENPSAYTPLSKDPPKPVQYAPSSRDKVPLYAAPYKAPSYMEKRELPPSREKPSYMDRRDLPPSRDKQNYPDYRVPSREAPKPVYQYNPVPNRGIAAPYAPAYRDLPSRDAHSREAGRDLQSRDKQYAGREISSREAQRPVQGRYAPEVREARPGSREVEHQGLGRAGVLVLQTPKQLVPKGMPSPGAGVPVKAQYGAYGRGQRINPVWWG